MENNEKECRICFDTQEEPHNRLITPCLCRGSQKYIHEVCLHQWRYSDPKFFDACPTCKFKYMSEIPWYIEFLSTSTAHTIIAWVFLLCIAYIMSLIRFKHETRESALKRWFIIVCIAFMFKDLYYTDLFDNNRPNVLSVHFAHITGFIRLITWIHSEVQYYTGVIVNKYETLKTF